MKLTQIQKELLYESAKRMLLETGFPMTKYVADAEFEPEGSPNARRSSQGGGQESQGNYEGYEDFKKGDEFDPVDFRKLTDSIFFAFKHTLTATNVFIKTMDRNINRYIKGDIRGDRMSILIQTAMDKPTKGNPDQPTPKSLNKSIKQFEVLMRKLEVVVESTNIPFNKKLYGYFYEHCAKLKREYDSNTNQYYRYLAFLSQNYFDNFVLAKHIPDKEWVGKYHEFSFSAKEWVEPMDKKYYKWSPHDIGTNKGFYRTVRDAFMNQGRPGDDEQSSRPNAYTGQRPDHSRAAIEHTGDDYSGAEHVFYIEYNRLLNISLDLTRKFAASNYKDMNVKAQIDEIREKIDTLKRQKQMRAPDDREFQKYQDIENKYQGWGAWNDFNEVGGKTKPATFKKSTHRSKDAPKEQPRYRTGKYDPDFEDYRRKNSPYDEED